MISHYEGGIELEYLSEGYCNAWSVLDFVSMVNVVERFTQKLGTSLLGNIPPRGSQGGPIAS